MAALEPRALQDRAASPERKVPPGKRVTRVSPEFRASLVLRDRPACRAPSARRVPLERQEAQRELQALPGQQVRPERTV